MRNYKPIGVWLWLFHKATKNVSQSRLFVEFIQNQKRYHTSLDKTSIVTWKLLVVSSQNLSVTWQKGESQNGCFKKIRDIKFSEKRIFLSPWKGFVPWNTRFWDSPFCHITDEFFLWAKLLESLLYNKYMISFMTRKFAPGCYDFKLRYFINRLWTIKGIVMQIEKARINDRLRVSKVFWKFCNPTIYNFAEIYPWNLLCS